MEELKKKMCQHEPAGLLFGIPRRSYSVCAILLGQHCSVADFPTGTQPVEESLGLGVGGNTVAWFPCSLTQGLSKSAVGRFVAPTFRNQDNKL